MDEYESLSHTKWDCKYHVVSSQNAGDALFMAGCARTLEKCSRSWPHKRRAGSHLMPDHVHMMIANPPKYSVSQVVRYIKGKCAIHLARVYAERKRGFVGLHFWARGCFVSTVGRDEELIREYIRNQAQEDKEQLNLWR